MARVTLATIATHTGLSKFAVSRSLSGKDGVSDATRKLVCDVAKELGYAPPKPKGLQRALGLVFHDTDLVNSELHMMVQNGVQRAAQRLGYQVTMRWTHLPDEIESFARDCAGLIMVGPHGKPSVTRARATGTPIVRIGWLDPLEATDQVSGTDHEAGAAVATYLLELGHRVIAYVHGAPVYRGRKERYYGAREVLEARDDTVLRDLRFEAESRFSETLRALHAEGTRPTAFFCAHDGLAVTVVSDLLRLGYRIPEDVSVVGFGDFSSALQISPPLTTVRLRGADMGATCVRQLDDRIRGRIDPDVPLRVLVASTLVIRSSSGPAPGLQAAPARQDAPALAGS